MASGTLALLVALIAVALIFDFLNGLHDAANSIATVVSTCKSRSNNPSLKRPMCSVAPE